MAILVAIDGTEKSSRVVTIAADLAIRYEDTLVALHVVPTENYDAHRESLQETSEFQDFSIDQEAASASQLAETFADAVLDDASDAPPIDPRGRVGDVPAEILDVAETIKPRFLVIGGRRRSPAGKAIFGDTTQQILLNANCPVVTTLESR